MQKKKLYICPLNVFNYRNGLCVNSTLTVCLSLSDTNTLITDTHVDEVLFKPFAQVLDEGRLTGVVLQEDKVLHPHSVSGCQGRLHHSPHPVTSHHLNEDKEGGSVSDLL